MKKTELSKASRDILKAMYRSCDHEPTRRLIAAAVLRTTAKYLTPYNIAELDGAAMARNRLLEIATKLENTNV